MSAIRVMNKAVKRDKELSKHVKGSHWLLKKLKQFYSFYILFLAPLLLFLDHFSDIYYATHVSPDVAWICWIFIILHFNVTCMFTLRGMKQEIQSWTPARRLFEHLTTFNRPGSSKYYEKVRRWRKL